MPLEIGSVVEGVVTGITNFGAFVKLPEGNTGLIHISEVANTYVKDVRQFINEKDKVKVKVLGINNKGKYDLSLKQVSQETGEEMPPEPKPEPREVREPREPRGEAREFREPREREPRENQEPREFKGEDRGDFPRPKPREKYYREDRREYSGESRGYTFEDKLTRYLKESEERLLDLKRNTEAKRGKKR